MKPVKDHLLSALQRFLSDRYAAEVEVLPSRYNDRACTGIHKCTDPSELLVEITVVTNKDGLQNCGLALYLRDGQLTVIKQPPTSRTPFQACKKEKSRVEGTLEIPF